MAIAPAGTGGLRDKVIGSLEEQGFRVEPGRIVPPAGGKDDIRRLHRLAVGHRVEQARRSLGSHEPALLGLVASGDEVCPERIRPRLEVVRPGSVEALFFRYAGLHWSIPVSAGYGRRLRYVVYDNSNGKVIGIFGLGDPVFALGARDRWVGWDRDARMQRLRHVMDLFVLGAIPPYSRLLCGKLVALLATSREVQDEFRKKYGGHRSTISGKPFDGRLALLTTTSALGRSSLYNRLRHDGRTVFERVGFTQGAGEFHLSDGVYKDLRQLAADRCEATAKHSAWGVGFRNRREIVRKSLALLGLPPGFSYHGVQREVFLVPLAGNTGKFLRGDVRHLRDRRRPTVDELFGEFRWRWLLPRAARETGHRDFDPEEHYRLWGAE